MTTIRAAKQARRDSWREMAHSLRRIKDEHLWEDRGHATFDAWAWATVRLNSRQVSALLGIATEPIGGSGRPRPGRPPGRKTAGEPPADGAADDALRALGRTRARGQVGEVEGLPKNGSPSTSSDGPGGVPFLLGWVERTRANFERIGPSALIAGLPEHTDWPRLVRGLLGLEAVVRRSREAAQARSDPTQQSGGPPDA